MITNKMEVTVTGENDSSDNLFMALNSNCMPV